ncbi:hypothetical protein E0Z10_g5511 [Xylaria hypoxylon]|uniref:Uncharacterized protein n=1 Tax=Xylaria hypoxylon TaxID=37992 RepID=A0A4Z0YXQ3_9PEZI|nr:hypothetical protein E0Z10_g5511 [Xylaria hypoxylon]
MASVPPPPYPEAREYVQPTGKWNVPGNDGGSMKRSINVLVLGETAMGKSTLIRQLGIYSGIVNPVIKIGLGNQSCTKHVGNHPVSTSLRMYHLEDPSGSPIRNVDYADLALFTDDDAKLVPDQPESDGIVSNFNLIDTPGLDDSDGNDLEIMAEIIGRVSDLSHLNAVLYVLSINKPFGKSFKSLYDYLQRSMPVIANGVIAINTSCSVEKFDEALSSRRNLIKDRMEAFQRATPKGATNLPHFFMDNQPDETNPFAMMESFNACYKLLKLLSVQRPLEVSNIRLLKTPGITNVDTRVLLSLERLHGRLKKDLDGELARATKANNARLRMQAETARLRASLVDDEAELADLDRNSEIMLGTKRVAEDYSFETFLEAVIRLDKRDVSFDADCRISHVQKTVAGASRWLDEDLRGTTWRATLKAGLFRSLNGSATFYTTSRLKHRREIERLRSHIRDIRNSLSFLEDQIDNVVMDAADGSDVEGRKLTHQVACCASLIEKIQRSTFDAALWPVLKRFYTTHHTLSASELAELVMVYDHEIALLLSSS